MRTLWPGLLAETAETNFQTHQSMKTPSRETDPATAVAANLLSYTLSGKRLSSLGSEMDDQISATHSNLLEYSERFRRLYGLEFANDSEEAVNMKLGAAHEVVKIFSVNYLRLSSVPALPYAEHYSSEESERSPLFGHPSPDNASSFASSSLVDSFAELSITPAQQNLIEVDSALGSESESVLTSWEYAQSVKKRLIDIYSRSVTSHFESFGFPCEDLAEFVRIRTRLTGRIRCALDLLRMAKTSIEELTNQEYGFADIPLAIQLLASNTSRNEIYVRDETIAKSECWAILIDSSKSLENNICTVRDAAVCLAEVANGMLQSYESWACYTFNQNFNIIKDFSEPYSNDVKARIGGIGTGLKTFLPDAIRLAASRLHQVQGDYKVIVVVSDGYPQGYEGIDKQLLSVVEEVRKRGVSLVGIGVESTAISKYFRTNCVAHDAYELMKDFVNSYYETVAAAN
jgi:von Willebrand factor type A domain